MNDLIEKYAMQCISWPYWRDLPNESNEPSPMVTEWPDYVTEEQKMFWRNFVTNMIEDLRKDTIVVEMTKVDEILSILKS